MSAYQLRLPVFEGPLDLLLQLIERRQLDVTTVSLALVTDQYLEHLRAGGAGVDPDQLSEFVAVAAKLLLIKSMALLPQPQRPRADEPPPPDPTDLTDRLREYEAIKRAAMRLRSREEADLRSYPHVPPSGLFPVGHDRTGVGSPAEPGVGQANGHQDGHSPLPPGRLLAAFHRATSRRREEPAEVDREVWTVAQAIAWLLRAACEAGGAGFRRLVAGFGRARLVAAFLALLELHRLGKLRAHQPEPFADVELIPVEGETVEEAEGSSANRIA